MPAVGTDDQRLEDLRAAEGRAGARLRATEAAADSFRGPLGLPPARYWPARVGLERWAFVLLASSVVAVLTAVFAVPVLSGTQAMLLFLLGYGVAGAWLGLTTATAGSDRAAADARGRWREYVEGRHRSAAALAEARRDAGAAADALAAALAERRRLLGVEDVVGVDPMRLHPAEFELWLGRLFGLLGFEVESTPYSGDHGIDVVIAHGGVRVAVQAKRYTNNAGNDAVQQAVAGKAVYGCGKAAVVTTSGFTAAARTLAEANGCWLVDGADLERLKREATEYHAAPGPRPPPADALARRIAGDPAA